MTDQLNILQLMDKISPLNYERKMSLGDVYAQLGEKSLSVGCYEEALRLVNMQTREMISYARMQVGTRLKQVDAQQSLTYMKEAIELKGDDLRPSDLWMFNEIGCFLQKKGQWQQAVGYYKQALEIVPDDWGLTYHLAMAHFQGKQYQKAREYVEKALDHYPELLNLCADIPYNIAMIYYKLAQYAEASQYAKIACINDHDHAPARRLLSELKQRCLKRSGGNTRECTMYEDVPEPRS